MLSMYEHGANEEYHENQDFKSVLSTRGFSNAKQECCTSVRACDVVLS
jgi:hypothetical protein